MSEIVHIDRLETTRWGRASGFVLSLPPNPFVVLFGPNESGKSSLATALAWLLAGPGDGRLLQRFGSEGDELAASLRGQLGTEPLRIDVKARVPKAASRRTAPETLTAAIGDAALGRTELSARLGGGDFDSYRRFCWVEAMEVADGSNLTESVSVRAAFGGIDPFAEADRLAVRARELIGSTRGRAADGSARELSGRIERLDADLRALAGDTSKWASIEADLEAEQHNRDGINEQRSELRAQLNSVLRASAAFSDGRVGEQVRRVRDLEATPEPSAAERDLHRQTMHASSVIGRLHAAQVQFASSRSDFVQARSNVHGEWQPAVEGVVIGESGTHAAGQSEQVLNGAIGEFDRAEDEFRRQDATYQQLRVDADKRRTEWKERYPTGRGPAHVVKLHEARTGRTSHLGAVVGASDGRPLGRILAAGGSFVGVGCVAALTVLLALRSDWRLTLLAGAGAAALLVSLLVARRSLSALDDDKVDLAARVVKVEDERDTAQQRRTEADADVKRRRSQLERCQHEHRDQLLALGVPGDLISQFQPDIARHLRDVYKAQTARVGYGTARAQRHRHLNEVRGLFAGIPPAALLRAVATPRQGNEPAEAGAPSRDAAVAPSAIDDAAAAEALLNHIGARVDRRDDAARSARAADDELQRAVQFDEAALAHIARRDPASLVALTGEMQRNFSELDDRHHDTDERIAELRAAKKQLESSGLAGAVMSLGRSELSAQVTDQVVRGLGHHLAATLLRDAAEQHRKTRQPALLEHTKRLSAAVADWTNITVNPHSPADAKSSDHSDRLLVDGPHGEHSAQRLSFGAQSLLYLALRLATVTEQAAARGVRLPLVFDDVLVGLDDDRAPKCLDMLADCARRHQLILLTCHRQTAESAHAAGADVVPVPPAA